MRDGDIRDGHTNIGDAASYITGTALLVDGGWTAIDGPPTGLTKTHAN